MSTPKCCWQDCQAEPIEELTSPLLDAATAAQAADVAKLRAENLHLRQQLPHWEWTTTAGTRQALLLVGAVRVASVLVLDTDSWELTTSGVVGHNSTPARIRGHIAALGLPELPDPPESP